MRASASYRAALVLLLCGIARAAGLNEDLLVCDSSSKFLLRFDRLSGGFVAQYGPGGSADGWQAVFGPDGNLYVSSWGAGLVHKLDGQTGAYLGVFVPGVTRPRGMAFGPDGNLYVASESSVRRFNGVTGAPMGVFATVGATAFGLNFGPDGKLYVGDFFASRILRYDGTSGQFLDVFAAAGALAGPEQMVFGPDGNLYVGSYNNHSVVRYAPSGQPLGVFASGGGLTYTRGVAFGPDGNLYATGDDTPSVLRFDGQTGAFMGVFSSGATLANAAYLTLVPEPAALWLGAIGAVLFRRR